MIDPQLPGAWREWTESFSAANTTLAKILVDVAPAKVVDAVTGEIALPGEDAVRQRVLTGGQRIIDGSISSSDGTARSARLYVGRQTTLFANMTTASITGTNTLNRTAGSFITDGYKIGDAVMLFGCGQAANNGLLLIVTAVTALALTFNGTVLTNEGVLAAGFRAFRVALRTQRGIPINSGNGDAIPPVQLLGGSQDPASMPAPDTGLSLSADGALIVAMTATVSALPAQVNFHAVSALY